jgi:hypothetical protein
MGHNSILSSLSFQDVQRSENKQPCTHSNGQNWHCTALPLDVVISCYQPTDILVIASLRQSFIKFQLAKK